MWAPRGPSQHPKSLPLSSVLLISGLRTVLLTGCLIVVSLNLQRNTGTPLAAMTLFGRGLTRRSIYARTIRALAVSQRLLGIDPLIANRLLNRSNLTLDLLQRAVDTILQADRTPTHIVMSPATLREYVNLIDAEQRL